MISDWHPALVTRYALNFQTHSKLLRAVEQMYEVAIRESASNFGGPSLYS
jgi:hypothetical protein